MTIGDKWQCREQVKLGSLSTSCTDFFLLTDAFHILRVKEVIENRGDRKEKETETDKETKDTRFRTSPGVR